MQANQSFPLTNASLDTEAMDCWQLAARIPLNRPTNNQPLRSFTSLLLALLYADNGWSHWFRRYANALPLALADIGADFDLTQIKTLRAGEGAYGANEPSASEVPASELPGEGWTVSAQGIVQSAAEVHSATSDGSAPLGVRHLIGAYFYRLPSDHQAQMSRWGFDLPREASALLRQVRRRVPAEEKAWIDLHQRTFTAPPALEASDPLPVARISRFAADLPEGEDQLDIEDDVYSLSALICSTRITPPLSIGLFGDWGSGKSFFIRQMQRGAAWISEQARSSGRSQRELPFYKHVVQIEFNAWNYSAGNLWAALVQHILENLRLSRDEPENLVEARRAHLQQEMELERKVRDAAQQKKAEAEKKLKQATQALDDSRTAHDAKVQELAGMRVEDVLRVADLDQGTRAEINTLLESLGLQKASGSAADFLSALEGSRALLARSTALWGQLPSEGRGRFAAGAAAVLLAPPLAAVAVAAAVQYISPHASGVAAAASWLSTTLAALATWLRTRNEQVSKQLGKVEALSAQARQRVEAAQQTFRAHAAALEHEIELARNNVAAAQVQQQEAAARLDKIEQVLDATTPASVLADFVRERAESDDYRKHLGLPAVIRRDFEHISSMVAQDNKALTTPDGPDQEESGDDTRINRIVLYIDDLDRCTEELVVEVLKAVHLLLAFPLFVVVVAVDARWVSRSLSRRFPGLLSRAAAGADDKPESEADHATTDDYLEKIFQIPFWLRPPSDVAARSMLRSLVPEVTVAHAGNGVTGGHTEASGSTEPAAAVFKQHRHDPQATSLDLTDDEMGFIERLVPLLEHSPRSLKRFINIYRLLKASLPPDEESNFMDLQGAEPFTAPYRAVLWLLALTNGLQRASDCLFPALLDVPASLEARTAAQANMGKLIAALGKDPSAPPDEIERVTAWLDRYAKETWKATDPSLLGTWVHRVSRYSYRPFTGSRG